MLAQKNAHPRDAMITFDEAPHLYYINGKGGYTSVTTWNHSHFAHFDADGIIDGMQRKIDTDPTYKYYQMTRAQIKQDWDKNRDAAAQAGTKMHADIENYWNGLSVDNESTEFGYFLQFARDFPNLVPYRTEWMVFYEEYLLAGSIDMVFENADTGNTLEIYDWKRSKEIVYEAYGNKTAITPCIRDMPDCNFWHYTLQLNVYKMMLERKYEKQVTALYLVCLHPDYAYKTYERISVPILPAETMQQLLDHRLQRLQKKKKKLD
jgi:ATP-dependent exoDNAse (exonuclease V) beta subunit